MTTQRIDVLVWVLIYGGLIAVCLGVFVQRGDAPSIGWALVVGGALAAAVGLLLIWFRSTIKETPS